MEVRVLHVESDFELLKDSLGDPQKNMLLLSIYFLASKQLDESMLVDSYFEGQVSCEIDADADRREEYGSELYYVLHVVVYDDINPAYGAVSRQLLGDELHDMLQLSWREESIAANVESGDYDFNAALRARSQIQMSREVYSPPLAVGERILGTILSR